MIGIVAASLVAAVGFALIHLYGGRLTFLSHVPRSRWLSFAGGVAVAYVFVHLLPELREHQERVEERLDDGGGGVLAFLEAHVYLLALIGLVAFYGLERAAKSSSPRRRSSSSAAAARERAGRGVFAIHVVAYGLYNALVGYLLLHREDSGWHGFVFYAVAMGLHFLVNDRGLEADHGHLYRTYGRWLLAAVALAGWGAGVAFEVDRFALSALFAFLAGGVILNVLKEELPEERESRFSAFAGGALLYAALLLAALRAASARARARERGRAFPPPRGLGRAATGRRMPSFTANGRPFPPSWPAPRACSGRDAGKRWPVSRVRSGGRPPHGRAHAP